MTQHPHGQTVTHYTRELSWLTSCGLSIRHVSHTTDRSKTTCKRCMRSVESMDATDALRDRLKEQDAR